MKYIVLILCCILSTACTRYQSSYSLVEVIGTRDGTQVVRGMGVCIDDVAILTSAHVVRDDTISYELRVTNDGGISRDATVTGRDTETDVAYLNLKNEKRKVKNICKKHGKYIGKVGLTIGQSISIPVIRSGSVITLTGSITSLTGTVLAYDTLGRTQLMTGVLKTDITTQPGDSGAPILDRQGRVVDVVHIQ